MVNWARGAQRLVALGRPGGSHVGARRPAAESGYRGSPDPWLGSFGCGRSRASNGGGRGGWKWPDQGRPATAELGPERKCGYGAFANKLNGQGPLRDAASTTVARTGPNGHRGYAGDELARRRARPRRVWPLEDDREGER